MLSEVGRLLSRLATAVTDRVRGREPERGGMGSDGSDGSAGEPIDGMAPFPAGGERQGWAGAMRPGEFIPSLVGDAGGRMWQSDIVSATDLSASTVSRRLSALESEGTIERFIVGRQKVVCLPSEVPPVVETAGTRTVEEGIGPTTTSEVDGPA